MKKLLICIVVIALLFSSCYFSDNESEGIQISLSDDRILIEGKEITSDESQAVYAANDIIFYPAGYDFTFGEGQETDEHEQSEADAHTVVHITQPGRYVLSGELSCGQIAVDLGEEAKDDPEATVTLILNGVDVTCSVAPAIIFYNVYECCDSDEEKATKDVDTSKAGANVIIADGSENNICGSYVAKIYESCELNEDGTEVVDSKKLHKYDGAFYSKMTMNIGGEEKGDGVLNIKAENEGLNSELHLTLNGGIINITAGNDGINTNEDNVSVTTINGGELNILCNGTTGEGDGIDSNGWLVINGGSVSAQACSVSGDAGIDSDKGIYINGGHVVASGNMLDHIAGGDMTYAVFNFADSQNGGSTYVLKNSSGEQVCEYAPENAFTYLIVAGEELVPDDYTFWKDAVQLSCSQVNGMPQMTMPEMPEGAEDEQNVPPEVPEDMIKPEMPEGAKDEQNVPPEIPEGMTTPEMPGEKDFGGERPDNAPQGERPDIPDMPQDMMPPDDNFDKSGREEIIKGELSTAFVIAEGGNMFSNIVSDTK